MMTMLMMALLVPLPQARNAVVPVVPAPHLVVMMMMMNHCSWMMMMTVVATVLLEVKPRLPRLRRLPLTKLCPSCHAFSV